MRDVECVFESRLSATPPSSRMSLCCPNCCFLLTHQISLARQSGVQLPTAGIWVCAFNIINNLVFGWMSSQGEGSSTEGLWLQATGSFGRGSFLKWSGWDANDCSPAIILGSCLEKTSTIIKSKHQPSTMFTLKPCPQVPHPLLSHCTQLWLFWLKEALES